MEDKIYTIENYLIELTGKVDEMKQQVNEITEALKGSIDYNDRIYLDVSKKKIERLKSFEK